MPAPQGPKGKLIKKNILHAPRSGDISMHIELEQSLVPMLNE